VPEIKKLSRRNVNGMRRWRDRTKKIIHAFDPHQPIGRDDVTTLCGETVYVQGEGSFAPPRQPLGYMPKPEHRTPDLPSLTTKLTCLMCLAAL
jgi:hypothetical protein